MPRSNNKIKAIAENFRRDQQWFYNNKTTKEIKFAITLKVSQLVAFDIVT